MVMDYTNCDLQKLDDGTAILAEFEAGYRYVYSPSLPLAKLEAFCNANMGRYVAFFERYQSRLNKGYLIPMARFW